MLARLLGLIGRFYTAFSFCFRKLNSLVRFCQGFFGWLLMYVRLLSLTAAAVVVDRVVLLGGRR